MLSEFDIKVSEMKSDLNAQDQLIQDYRPYILSCASKITGRFLNSSDEETSIAILAFAEAIKAYDPEKGPFLLFSKTVIKSRLIDYLRKEQHYGYFNEPLDETLPDKSYERQQDIITEIKQLESDLKSYNISFTDLVKASPKAAKTKHLYLKITSYILGNKPMLLKLTSGHIFPIKEIEIFFKVPRKRIERGRNYIIATVIILSGDYDYLREYVKLLQ
jgi:RNA polymerase sigma factor